MRIIKRDTSDIKIYSDTIEYKAYDQIKELGMFDAYKDSKIRIMPDCHAGAGCTIGTTMEIEDKITPNLVGVDIGCGMLTVQLRERHIDMPMLDAVINSKIPSGYNAHEAPVADFDFDRLLCKNHVDIVRGAKSIGSLGGGNHFIEINKGSDGNMYMVIHSGSRGVGNQVARYYQNVAWKNVSEMGAVKENLIKRLKAAGREREIASELKKVRKPKANKALAYLTGDDFNNYMHDLAVMQEYAALNRSTIAKIVLKEARLTAVGSFETIHNYVDFNRMILRKGAVSAEAGEVILIPINMRDGSILAIGKGNEDWNYSAPHGAGRLMGRRVAKEALNMDTYIDQMKNVYTTSVSESTLDEAPDAYKPIDEILDAIQETADVIDILKPVYNFKAN